MQGYIQVLIATAILMTSHGLQGQWWVCQEKYMAGEVAATLFEKIQHALEPVQIREGL